jgi:protein-disulfide isomerase
MKRVFFIAGLAVATLVLPATAALAQRDANREGRGGERRSDGPERRNWTETVVRTPEGGVRMGDPDAPVKLVQYVSLTCQDCARFTAEGGERLFQYYVRFGRVSIEYRTFTQNAYDLAAAFLIRCAEPKEYFELSHYLLGHQPQWMGRMQSLTDAQRAELRAMTPIQAMQRIVQMLGLESIASRHGLSASEQRACLADEAALGRIGQEMQIARDTLQVTAAPAFLINGAKQNAANWAQLEPLLRAAIGG